MGWCPVGEGYESRVSVCLERNFDFDVSFHLSFAHSMLRLIRVEFHLICRGSVMSGKGQHVVPNGGKWSVRKAGAARATGTFSTQSEAIQEARKIAKNQGSELYIHGRDGRIRERDSYGSDPKRSKG